MNIPKKPINYENYWDNVIKDANQEPLQLVLESIIDEQTHTRQEFKFKGYDHFDIYGFILRPQSLQNKYPVIVHYHGYSWHRGMIKEFLPLLKAGYAVLSYDFRHQGGKSGQQINDCLFLNINQLEHFYYRYALIDAIKVLNIVDHIKDLDHQKIALNGFSQGGGVACLVYGHTKRGHALMIDAPGMTNYQCRYQLKAGSASYYDEYAKKNNISIESFLETLLYFDVMHIADQIDVPVILSSSENDPVCPLECFIPTYDMFKGTKEIIIYPSDQHDDGGLAQLEKKILFLNKVFNT